MRKTQPPHEAKLIRVHRLKRVVIDLAASAAVPFLGIWAYEIANWIAMAAQGYPASLTVSGWLPLGVSAVSSGGISPLTKVIQVILAVAFLVPLGAVFGRARLPISRTLVVSMAGVFIASSYWEALSVADALPMAVHTAVFITGAGAMSFVTLWALDRRRLRPPLGVGPGSSMTPALPGPPPSQS